MSRVATSAPAGGRPKKRARIEPIESTLPPLTLGGAKVDAMSLFLPHDAGFYKWWKTVKDEAWVVLGLNAEMVARKAWRAAQQEAQP